MDLFKKESKEVISDRAFLVSILIQFITISLLLFLYSTYTEVIHSPNLKITVAVDTNNTILINRLESAGVRVILANASNENANAVINSSSGEVKTDPTSIFSGFAIAKINSISKELSFDEALEEKNFTFSSFNLANENTDFIQMAYGLIIPIAIIMPAMVAMSLAIQSILMERKKRTIELLLVSPLSNFDIILSKAFPYVLASTVSSIAWVFLIMRTIQVSNFLLLLLFEFFFSLFLVSVSMIISAKAASVKEANAISSLVGMITITSIVIPYNPLSLYFPAVMIARIASNALDSSIVIGILSLCFAGFLAFAMATKSIGDMRNNFV